MIAPDTAIIFLPLNSVPKRRQPFRVPQGKAQNKLCQFINWGQIAATVITERALNRTGVFFAWACAPRPDKEHTSVTATLVHSHRNQILHFESLVEIQMVAGTWERPSVVENKKRYGGLKWRLMLWTSWKSTFFNDVWHEHGCLLFFGARLVSWFPFKNYKVWHRMYCWWEAIERNVLYVVFVYKSNVN